MVNSLENLHMTKFSLEKIVALAITLCENKMRIEKISTN